MKVYRDLLPKTTQGNCDFCLQFWPFCWDLWDGHPPAQVKIGEETMFCVAFVNDLRPSILLEVFLRYILSQAFHTMFNLLLIDRVKVLHHAGWLKHCTFRGNYSIHCRRILSINCMLRLRSHCNIVNLCFGKPRSGLASARQSTRAVQVLQAMREEKDACSLQWLISLRWRVVPYIHEYIISYLIYVHIYNTLYYVYHTSICLDNISTNIKTCICLFEVDVQENCSKQRGGKRGMKTACSWTIDNVSVTCLLCLWTVFWSNDQHLDPAWMCPISFYMFIIYNIYMVDPQDDLEVVHLQVETNIFHFSAAISACEKANHWQLALEMVQQMRQAWKTSPTHMVFPGTASRAAFLPFNLCMFISLMIVFNLTSRSLYVFLGVKRSANNFDMVCFFLLKVPWN